ncbi:MAG: hypothetical protein AB8B50_19005 [Pirellulaceae bacterium]
MTSSQREQEPIVLENSELGRLEFNWSGDRFAHSWTFGETQFQSVESSSEEAWPLSPPLQQIHSQSFADGREIIFGVGMAGRGHWSASFTLVPELRCWIVELACRCTVDTGPLSCCYQLPETNGEAQLQDGVLSLSTAPTTLLEPIAPGTELEIKDGQVMLCPRENSTEGETIQWAYRIRIV